MTCVCSRSRAFVGMRLLVAAVLTALFAGPVRLAAAQPLNPIVEEVVRRSKLGTGVRVGVYAFDIKSKSVLAAINPTEALTPASNQKVLTTGAAILVLGPEFVFSTELIRDGDRLVVRGSGDPALCDPEVLDQMDAKLSVDQIFDILAKSVVDAGLKGVREVVVDERVFDREYVHPSWPKHQLTDWYCAEVAGLNFHTNVLSVWLRPSTEGFGKRPTRTAQPDARFLSIDNQARTVGDGKNLISLIRTSDDNTFKVTGEVRFATQEPVETTVHNPGLFFGQVLADRLDKSGVRVGAANGSPQAGVPNPAVRLATTEESLGEDRVLARVTTPITDILRRCNKDSHNLYAEALMKRVGFQTTGEPGSWKNGASVMRMLISQELGAEAAASTVIADGSGMSRDNAVSAQTLARWLGALAGKEDRIANTYIESFSTPGEGRMRDRFRGMKLRNEVRAKSGYIKGVRSLSGYVTDTSSGRRVAYAILLNNVPEDAGAVAKRVHEEIVYEFDRYLSRQAGAAKPGLGG